MSLLDQLERQARERREQEERDEALRSERRDFYRTHTAPAMRKIFDYLKTLSSHLKYLDQTSQKHYTIPQYGQVTATIDPDIKVRLSTEKGVRSEILILATGRIDERSSQRVTVNAQQAEALDQVIIDHSFSARKRVHKNAEGEVVGGTYRIVGEFLLRGTIQARVESPEIELELSNFVELGIQRRKIRADQIDDEFIDRLGRYLVGNDQSLLRDDVSGDYRDRIQRRLQRSEREKKMEMLDYEIGQIDREERSKASITGRITQRFAFLARRLKKAQESD